MDSSTVMLVGSSHCTIFPRFQEFLNPLSFIKQTSSSRFTTDIAGAKAGTKKKEEKNPGPDAVSARPPTYAEQRHVLSYLRGAVSLGTGDPRASGLAAAQRAGDAESGAGRDGSARTERGECPNGARGAPERSEGSASGAGPPQLLTLALPHCRFIVTRRLQWQMD